MSSKIEAVIEDVTKGLNSLGDRRKELDFVQYAYSAYIGKINFPKNVVDYCSGTRAAQFQVGTSINENVVSGIIQSLKNYANALTEQKNEPHTKIENIFTPTSSVEVNVSISIEEAKKQAEESGLSQKQLDEINEKIDEINRLLNEKESKHKKWAKAGEILKWVAEQSIQVASFMVPLICQLAR